MTRARLQNYVTIATRSAANKRLNNWWATRSCARIAKCSSIADRRFFCALLFSFHSLYCCVSTALSCYRKTQKHTQREQTSQQSASNVCCAILKSNSNLDVFAWYKFCCRCLQLQRQTRKRSCKMRLFVSFASSQFFFLSFRCFNKPTNQQTNKQTSVERSDKRTKRAFVARASLVAASYVTAPLSGREFRSLFLFLCFGVLCALVRVRLNRALLRWACGDLTKPISVCSKPLLPLQRNGRRESSSVRWAPKEGEKWKLIAIKHSSGNLLLLRFSTQTALRCASRIAIELFKRQTQNWLKATNANSRKANINTSRKNEGAFLAARTAREFPRLIAQFASLCSFCTSCFIVLETLLRFPAANKAMPIWGTNERTSLCGLIFCLWRAIGACFRFASAPRVCVRFWSPDFWTLLRWQCFLRRQAAFVAVTVRKQFARLKSTAKRSRRQPNAGPLRASQRATRDWKRLLIGPI